jgi:hypothetical protein
MALAQGSRTLHLHSATIDPLSNGQFAHPGFIGYRLYGRVPSSFMCIHPTGRSIWLATIECQDFAIVKPKQSLAKTQASYTAGAIQFTTHLKDQGWTISDASLDPNAFGPSGIIFTKTIGANACWLRVSFGIAPGAFECNRNVKVPVLPLPYYYEYYGGG